MFKDESPFGGMERFLLEPQQDHQEQQHPPFPTPTDFPHPLPAHRDAHLHDPLSLSMSLSLPSSPCIPPVPSRDPSPPLPRPSVSNIASLGARQQQQDTSSEVGGGNSRKRSREEQQEGTTTTQRDQQRPSPSASARESSRDLGHAVSVYPKVAEDRATEELGHLSPGPVRVLRIVVHVPNMITHQDYPDSAFQDPIVAQMAELIYETDEGRVSRDMRRHSLYKWNLMQGELLRCRLDLTNLIPGFAALGRHFIYVFYGVDSYGPVFSLNGILAAMGYRTGGSVDQVLRALLEDLPLELKNRVVPVTIKKKSKTTKEFMADLYTAKFVLQAFGIKHKKQRSGNRVLSLICEALSQSDIASRLSFRLLHAPAFEL